MMNSICLFFLNFVLCSCGLRLVFHLPHPLHTQTSVTLWVKLHPCGPQLTSWQLAKQKPTLCICFCRVKNIVHNNENHFKSFFILLCNELHSRELFFRQQHCFSTFQTIYVHSLKLVLMASEREGDVPYFISTCIDFFCQLEYMFLCASQQPCIQIIIQ